MEVLYRKVFLKDLKKLKNQPVYDKVFKFAFEILPEAKALKDISGIKAMTGYSKRYRIRFGDYRVGIELQGDMVDIRRVLHRRDFYRYFP
ncbi:MAG: type II toxin-antitoxin system RelE/ParE family toxin [Desulfobacterales bacterium]|nr:type II toxin-antitoxin system RelE/ParE family toxin [Desulfobacterales bacterium]